jgi:hypothetical protein
MIIIHFILLQGVSAHIRQYYKGIKKCIVLEDDYLKQAVNTKLGYCYKLWNHKYFEIMIKLKNKNVLLRSFVMFVNVVATCMEYN